MYILDVIPLTKIPFPFPQVLTYFSREKVVRGALVKIAIGSRKVAAVVESCSEAEKRKLEIKKSPFPLKSIQGVITQEKVLTETQFQLAKWLNQQYLASLGPTFKLFLPRSCRERKRFPKYSVGQEFPRSQSIAKKRGKPLLLWQRERWNFYRQAIETVLAEGKQVFLLAPEIHYLQKMEEKIRTNTKQLVKEIWEISPAVIQSNLKSSEELAIWQKIARKEINLILGARSALFLPFQDLGLIIVEQEENPAYESWGKEPRYNAKELALKLGEISGAKVIMGTDLPSVESYYYAKERKYDLIAESKEQKTESREQETGNIDIDIVDMKKEVKRGNFSIFSQRLLELLKDSVGESEQTQNQSKVGSRQTILFINRRGLSTALLCQECGFISKCKNCDVPFVYHLEAENPILICHHCGQKEVPPAVCSNCGGFRIKHLGKGTQKVFEELRKIFPRAKILRLDSDVSPTLEEQKAIINNFFNKKADILVATQLLLKFSIFLSPKATPRRVAFQFSNFVGIVLIDHLLNLPEFRSQERVFQILTKVKYFGKRMIVQTYNPELSIFQCFKEDRTEDFLREELEQRKALSYPPFSEIIQLTFSHKDAQKAEKEAQDLKIKLLKTLTNIQYPRLPAPEAAGSGGQAISNIQILGPAPNFIPKIKGKYGWQIIIKIKNQKSKIKKILLENISPGWKIEVNPESLL